MPQRETRTVVVGDPNAGGDSEHPGGEGEPHARHRPRAGEAASRRPRCALPLFLPRPPTGGGRVRARRQRRRSQDSRLPRGEETSPRTGDGLMDDLRSEIRSAFEREQAGHAPAAGLRSDVVEAITARSLPSRNFQWVAVVAAVLLGIVVVAGLMSTRLAHRASVPAATPNAS